MSEVVNSVQVGSVSWHEYLSALRGNGVYHAPVAVHPALVADVDAAFPENNSSAWWMDAPDEGDRVFPFSVFDTRRSWYVPGPRSLMVPRTDTVTNARMKSYLFKNVLQIANDDIFPTGNFEATNGKKRRGYDVSKPGEAEDKERSLEEAKRRAKSKVQDISLCNQFTHMFTWTLDGAMIDRYNADEVYQKVRAFLSNMTQRRGFRYVCIPEYHVKKEGEEVPAIHLHGLCMLGDVQLSPSIRANGSLRNDTKGRQIFNMLDWSWGWSTVVKLDENYERAVGYITKYITKAESKIFGKWYLSSRALVKAPDVIPLERMNYENCKDVEKLESGVQKEVNVYLDVKILTEEFSCADGLRGVG